MKKKKSKIEMLRQKMARKHPAKKSNVISKLPSKERVEKKVKNIISESDRKAKKLLAGIKPVKTISIKEAVIESQKIMGNAEKERQEVAHNEIEIQDLPKNIRIYKSTKEILDENYEISVEYFKEVLVDMERYSKLDVPENLGKKVTIWIPKAVREIIKEKIRHNYIDTLQKLFYNLSQSL